MPDRRVQFIFGTRPEAIKLCPLVRHFREHRKEWQTNVCVTAQHRGMLDQVLDVFQVTPDHDLNVMRPNQSLTQATSRILAELEQVLKSEKPDVVLVQGDTTTTLCGALAAFYANIPVGHVEAGLRTGDLREPFPEEMNRVLVTRLSALHFAATPLAAGVLEKEGVSKSSVFVTGNTGIDALLYMKHRLERGTVQGPDWPALDPSRKLILVTAHRRENFGAPLDRICEAIRRIADLPGVQVVYPVHPNPNVSGPVHRELGGHPNIRLIEPLDYIGFVDLARRCYLLLTDSGGIQEEGPSLGKPVLVLREQTERPEAVHAGTATLLGTDVEKIVQATELLLNNPAEYQRRSQIHNPFGDGHASEKIAAALSGFFGAGH